MAGLTEPLKSDDVRWTYRYLRIGMIGAVVLLAVSIGIERSKLPCLQNSISAYYYTPVRSIFVGFLFAISLTLIVYKGRWYLEDLCLTFSGMLGPVVAVAPTTDVGTCWSVEPDQLPVINGSLANWVVASIENNIQALMVAGLAGLVLAIILAFKIDPQRLKDWRTNPEHRKELRRTWIPLIGVAVAMGFVFWASFTFDGFNTRAHGFAAVGMIVFLGLAIIFHAVPHLREGDGERDKRFAWTYLGIAGLMALGGVFIWLTRIFGERTIFALEAYEILLFASYWVVQTIESWKEAEQQPSTTKPAASEVASGTQQG